MAMVQDSGGYLLKERRRVELEIPGLVVTSNSFSSTSRKEEFRFPSLQCWMDKRELSGTAIMVLDEPS